jgi:protein O-mannosyl-transferase
MKPPPANSLLVSAAPIPFWQGTAFRAGVLLAFTLVVYLPSYRAGFIWDDDTYLTENPLMQNRWGGLHDIWFSRKPIAWFPLTFTSFWLEWQLWGMNATGYHVVNVLLHAASAVLLWRVLRQLDIRAAWLAALLFAVHPVCVASVSWITERKNTLSMLFYLLSLLLYLRSESDPHPAWPPKRTKEDIPQPTSASSLSRHPLSLYSLSLLAFVLALLSKASVVMLPLVLLLIAWYRRGCVTRRDFLRALPFFAAAFVMGLVTLWFENHRAGPEDPPDAQPIRILAGTRALWFYLGKIVLPQNLMMIYPRWRIDPDSPISYLPGILGIAAFLLFWSFRNTWGRPWLFAFTYFLFALAPVLGVFNVNFFTHSQVSDHLQYLAVPGMIAFLVAGLYCASQPFSPLVFRSLAAVLVLLLSVLTWQNQKPFACPEALWRHNLAKNPASWKVHNDLGIALAVNGKLEAALDEFKAALRIVPGHGDLYFNLARALRLLGRLEESIQQYRIALQNRPQFPERVHLELACAFAQQGKPDEAIANFEEALRLKPDLAEARYNLGNALLKKGRADEAMAQFQQAVQIEPELANAHSDLGNLLLQKGRVNEAIAQYQRSLELQPANALFLNNLAWLLATCPQASVRNGAKALELAQQAERLSGGRHPAILGTVAAAYAEAGRLPEALATAQHALELATAQTNSAQADILRANIALYQERLPLRDTEQTNAAPRRN